MRIKIGDTVKFLNEVGGGKVSRILDRETALILGNDGFEIPVLINELLIDEQATVYELQNKTKEIIVYDEPEEEEDDEIYYTNNPDVNLYLAFIQKNQDKLSEPKLEIYLINDSNYFVFFNYAVGKDAKHQSVTGILEPNTKDIIKTINYNSFNDTLNIVIQLIFFDKSDYVLREPYSKHFKIRNVTFYKENSFKENDFFDELAFIKPIIEDNAMKKAVEKLKKEDIKKIIVNKEQVNIAINKPKKYRKRIERKIKEVDLHLHELIDDETGLSDYEKLKLQLNMFHSEMKSAINKKIRKIVFIHGVGSGVLKLELRRELQRTYKKYQFQDASFKQYGYGATMVILRT